MILLLFRILVSAGVYRKRILLNMARQSWAACSKLAGLFDCFYCDVLKAAAKPGSFPSPARAPTETESYNSVSRPNPATARSYRIKTVKGGMLDMESDPGQKRQQGKCPPGGKKGGGSIIN